MSKYTLCNHCNNRVRNMASLKHRVRRVCVNLSKFPNSSMREGWKQELVDIKARLKEDQLEIDACECTAPVRS